MTGDKICRNCGHDVKKHDVRDDNGEKIISCTGTMMFIGNCTCEKCDDTIDVYDLKEITSEIEKTIFIQQNILFKIMHPTPNNLTQNDLPGILRMDLYNIQNKLNWLSFWLTNIR